MFPHARNSLRRWSASEQGSKKVPIPIGVSLHNVVASTLSSSPNHEHSPIPSVDKWFRPNHEIHLLPLLKLEVLVEEHGDDTEGGSNTDEGADSDDSADELLPGHKYRAVYTSPSLTRSVQPAWEHLDERIDLPGEWWRRGGIYRTMKLRISRIIESHGDESQEQEKKRQQEEKTEKDTTSPNAPSAAVDHIFLEIPLYPSKLERLHRDNVPKSLPPNACFVHFSDGSTRCSPILFSILLKRHLTEPAPMEDFSRFEDDVFRALDGAPATPEPATRLRAESVSALLEPQDLSSRLIDEFDGAGLEEELKEPIFDETETSAVQSDTLTEQQRLLAMIALEESQLEKEVKCLREVRTVIFTGGCLYMTFMPLSFEPCNTLLSSGTRVFDFDAQRGQ